MTFHSSLAISSSDAEYRPEIDGLRAIAVLLVVAYHVGVTGVSGGFVGVDVFFVISGFLITQGLLTTKGRKPAAVLAEFYARRARRILPSLAMVTLVTLGLGWLLLLPTGEQQDLAKSSIASALFTSNIFFWQMGRNYFAGPMELQPLLHTWSLSVEEQFYLVWPILLLSLWAVERRLSSRATRLLPGVLLSVTAVSLVLSVWWTGSGPRAAFFLTPSRVWELGTGASLAVFWGAGRQARLPEALGVLGLMAIAAAAFLYTPSTPFPGLAATLPVAGAALVVMAARPAPAGLLHGALTSPAMLLTGRLSYAWYLWHWPLLAIARTVDLGRHKFWRDLALAGVAYGLAYVSTRFLEAPIRQKRVRFSANARGALVAGLALIAILIAFPVGLWATARAEYARTYAHLRPATLPCAEPFLNHKLEPQSPCILATGNRGVVFLIGDSFANHWSPAISGWARPAGVYAIERSFSACNILAASQDDATMDTSECATFARRVMQDIRSSAATGSTVGVVVGAAWPRDTKAEGLARRLEAGLAAIERLNARVVVIGASPLFPFSVPACVARRPLDSCRLARQAHDAATSDVNALLARVTSAHENVRLWDPTGEFCDEAWCYPTRRGSLLFADGGHISPLAAEEAIPRLAPNLSWLISK